MRARFSRTLSGASLRADAAVEARVEPSDTPPSRVKNAWRMLGNAERDGAWIMRAGMAGEALRVKSRQRPELRIGDRQHLEQLAHLVRRGQTRRARRRCRRLAAASRWPSVARRAVRSRGGAGIRPAGSARARARPARCAQVATAGEIDLRGQIGLARILQRVGERVAAHGLQGVAERAFGMAVVDDQRRAAMPRDAPRQQRHRPVVAPFEDRADRRVASVLGDMARASDRARRRNASLSSAMPTMRTCQPSRSLTNWLTGSASTNSFAIAIVGPSGHLFDAVDASAIGTLAFASVCSCSARNTGLISTRCTESAARNSGSACAARSASAISVPRPGPSSTRCTSRGRSHLLPHRRGPRADQLAEHLAHFRRGDEIAGRAERVARHVIAVPRMARGKAAM